MIYLTHLSGDRFLLNAELIREVEATPDTVITLTSGQKMIVTDSVEDVREAVIQYKRTISDGGAPFEGE